MEGEKWIKHYSSNHQILLVGEGDFSFTACLARSYGHASNMVATSLDSAEMLATKHPTAAANLVLREDKGCSAMHNVDACTMSNHHLLRHRKFDRIVFNCPHAGFPACKHSPDQISLHQNVVRGFLRNGCETVRKKGEIHVTHKTTYPFSQWEIEELAKEVGFKLNEKGILRHQGLPWLQKQEGKWPWPHNQ